MKKLFYYHTPIGEIGIAEEDGSICAIFFSHEKISKEEYMIKESSLIKNAYRQLVEYFNKQRKTFDLPLAPEGTEFQMKVWKALSDIPYGKTRSYKEIAIAIGNPKAVRAVGMANNKNPIPIIIPCHRVIGSDGKLAGYGGGLEIKEYLLKLEGVL